MKKYKSELMKVLHEQAVDFYKDGIISDAEMKGYDEDCLVQKVDTSASSTGRRSPLVASGASPQGHSVK
jgi:hypothetical protein